MKRCNFYLFKFVRIYVIMPILIAVFLLNQPIYSAEAAATKTTTMYDKLKSKQSIRALIVGDSIAQGTGASKFENKWFIQLQNLIKTKYKSIMQFTQTTTAGGITFGGWADYLTSVNRKDQYDVIFLCLGKNDEKGSVDQFKATYESLIRHMKSDNPNAEVITIVESSLTSDTFASSILALANYYKIPSVDMRKAFKNSGKPIETLHKDGVHPNDLGYSIYAKSIFNTIVAKSQVKKPIATLITKVQNAKQSIFKTVQRKHNWINNKGFIVNKDGSISGKAGATIELEFKGKLAGVELLANKTGDKFKVSIDGKEATEFSTVSSFDVNWEKLVSYELEDKKHVIRIEVLASVPSDHQIQIANIITN